MSSIILSNIICSESIYTLEEKKEANPQLPRLLSLPFLNMGTTFAIIQAEEPPSDWTDSFKNPIDQTYDFMGQFFEHTREHCFPASLIWEQ